MKKDTFQIGKNKTTIDATSKGRKQRRISFILRMRKKSSNNHKTLETKEKLSSNRISTSILKMTLMKKHKLRCKTESKRTRHKEYLTLHLENLKYKYSQGVVEVIETTREIKSIAKQ